MFTQYTHKFILMAFCIIATACGATEKNLLKSTSQIAVDYRDALNDNNINTLIQLSALPVTFINQEWESAPDGYGWMLGKKFTSKFDTQTGLNKFLETFSPGIEIKGTKATLIPRAEYDRFKTELSGSESLWNNLKAYIFTRGEYDVEHITIIGVNPETHKVQVLYAN